MPYPHTYREGPEPKTSKNKVVEEAVLHTVSSSTTTIEDDFLEQRLGLEADGMAFRVVDCEILVWYCGNHVSVQCSQKLDISWRVIVKVKSRGYIDE